MKTKIIQNKAELEALRKKARTEFVVLNAKEARVYPRNTPRCYIIDRAFLKEVVMRRWTYITKWRRARGSVDKRRIFLHQYILRLAKLEWPEACFVDGNEFNCTLDNLKPYDRELDGATRALFKNNKVGKKGVTYRKDRKKWQATIRVKRKLMHIGYYLTADSAAKAYAKAYETIYGRKPV